MEAIERNIRNLLTGELIRMVRDDFAEYTDEALAVARDELRARRVPESEFQPRSGADEEPEPETPAKEEMPADETPDLARMLKSGQADRGTLLGAMLREELQYVECYEALSDFVASMNIRCGEYQGNAVVFRKMDRENFILYVEEEGEDGAGRIAGCVAIGKAELTDRMDEIARGRGFIEEEEEEEPFDGFSLLGGS